MNREQLYNETVDILVNSYLNDTLRHNNCCACAIGNMVAARTGRKFVPSSRKGDHDIKWEGSSAYEILLDPKSTPDKEPEWYEVLAGVDLFMGAEEAYCYEHKMFNFSDEGRAAIEQLRSTGYTIVECAKIEEAFEGVNKEDCISDDDWMFQGLMAVIDVLDRIHEVDNEEITKQSKAKFVRCAV